MRGYTVNLYHDLSAGLQELAASDPAAAPRTIVIDSLPSSSVGRTVQSLHTGGSTSTQIFLLVSPESAGELWPELDGVELVLKPYEPLALVQRIRRTLSK